MKQFVIASDSTVDLPKSYLEEKQIPILQLSYCINGEMYRDLEGLSNQEFFDAIRNGAMPTTSQANPEEVQEALRPILQEGNDLLYISFSSGLSGSYNSARIAAEDLREEFPDAKIVVVDSLCASMGEGMLLYKAMELKEQGKTLEEIVEWIEANKLHICHNVTVDDLFHLHRGGRISKATAVLGTMVKIKPIIHVDDEGKLVVIGKERGRKKALHNLVDRMVKQTAGWENDIVMIVHGDCEEDAKYVQGLIEEQCGIHKFLINGIGAVIGSHTGPGVIAIFFMGNKERF